MSATCDMPVKVPRYAALPIFQWDHKHRFTSCLRYERDHPHYLRQEVKTGWRRFSWHCGRSTGLLIYHTHFQTLLFTLLPVINMVYDAARAPSSSLSGQSDQRFANPDGPNDKGLDLANLAKQARAAFAIIEMWQQQTKSVPAGYLRWYDHIKNPTS